MAGAGYKLFNTGDVLTAAQVNTYLQEQAVMVFADSSARTTALSGVLAEGMITYLKSDDKVYKYTGAAWVEVGGATSPLTTKGDLYTYSTADARLAVGTNGYTLVAASGETTGLKWQLAPAFHGVSVYNNAAQTISNATFTTVTFNSEWFDTDGFHSTTTNTSRLTVPSGFGGYYRVEAKLYFTSNGTGSRIGSFLKNGVETNDYYLEQGAYSNGKNFMHWFQTLNLAATDYMEVKIWQDSGGNLDTVAFGVSAFSLTYLGAA